MEKRRPRVLILSINPAELDLLEQQIDPDSYEVLISTSCDHAMSILREKEVELVISDEDLGELSGIDWLMDVRAEDPETVLGMLVSDARTIHATAEAVNRAGVAKIFPKPWEIDEVLADIEEAVDLYQNGSQKNRSVALSAARMRRFNREEKALHNRLGEQRTEIKLLEQRVVELEDAAADELLHPSASDPSPVVAALLELTRDHNPEEMAHCERVAQTATSCARALHWPESECEVIRVAALLHHIDRGEHLDERLVELRTGCDDHARRAGAMLASIPGLEAVSEVIAKHHEIWMHTEHERAPRGARLLQILSLFDELLHEPSFKTTMAGMDDADTALSRATDSILQLAGDRLDPDLAERCMTRLIPSLLGRAESMVPLELAEAGGVLSRGVNVGQLQFVPAGTKLTEAHLEHFRQAAANTFIAGVWVAG